MGARTIYQVLREAAARFGDAPALLQPRTVEKRRTVQTLTWNQYLRAVEEVACGLRTLGVAKGEVVALDSETRLEFYLADLGVMTNGSIAAALYPSYPAPDLVRTIRATGARVVFVQDPAAFEALKPAGADFWILLTGEAEDAITLNELREKGRQAMRSDPGLLGRMQAGYAPEDPAILYLTSGATGEPKMVLSTHAALSSNIDMGPPVLPLGPKDATVAFLPSAHIAQRVVIELLPMLSGMPVTFAESLLKLPQEIKTVRPTLLLAPPRMWERVYATVCLEIRKKPAAIQKAFYGALGLGLAAARYRQAGRPVPARIAAPLKAADWLFFRKIRARFGGRLAVPASGAAPLGKELAEFYWAIGMPLVEGYGLTEGGITSLNPVGRPKPGSIGRALPGVEMRVASDGELLIKGPCVSSGYYRDPATTAEVFRDGWLHTGDLAYIDSDGFIHITGRKKELIVSSTGKKIFPSRVENLFKMEPLISQVLLLGDGLPHLTALFTINASVAETLEGVKQWTGDLAEAPEVVAEMQRVVARVNRQLADFEQVRKYRVLPRDFSIEAGELTATMKVRRSRVIENFKSHVDQLYS
ncbi:MAG: long-chain fatty acid--CoA ligase [Bryobacteraceae bacterium]